MVGGGKFVEILGLVFGGREIGGIDIGDELVV
jgi:hypothetical protein